MSELSVASTAAEALAAISAAHLGEDKKEKEVYEKLSGPQKAAILLLALGGDTGAIWENLDDEELRDVSLAMSNLGMVEASLVENLIIEFVSKLSTSGALTGSYEQTQKLLTQFLPQEKVDTLMEEIRGPAGRTMWDKLGNVSETVLANYLKNEYPQTVAVVLSKVKPDHAASVLGCLPQEFALECMQRMLRMEPVARDILEKIEITLRNEFMTNLARTSKRDSHELMADIFNAFDRQTEGRFMSALEEKDRESAERIRSLMFVFDDLQKLDPGGIQTLLRAVEKDSLCLALKGANETMQDLFLSNMSERAAKILKDDMNAMGPVKLKDVDQAQQSMVYTAKDLADRGEIMLADGGGDDELIY
ncbi:MAG: flagellar motor switch protein FliG [Hirschia sp.]|nr:flagellar motor switch protein FliG [Hirschia sp.]MBF17683.1 flagellar motor switch protein FliG [Hirschia sp.]MBF20255.1 flagellar motor switch protein FliG [Hirschia sp.]